MPQKMYLFTQIIRLKTQQTMYLIHGGTVYNLHKQTKICLRILLLKIFTMRHHSGGTFFKRSIYFKIFGCKRDKLYTLKIKRVWELLATNIYDCVDKNKKTKIRWDNWNYTHRKVHAIDCVVNIIVLQAHYEKIGKKHLPYLNIDAQQQVCYCCCCPCCAVLCCCCCC